MIRPKTITFLLLWLSFRVLAQNLDPSDSILVKTYWNKVQIVSVSSKSGDLYTNINNRLELRLPENEFAPSNILLETNNGTVHIVDDKYVAIPQYAGNSYFRIYMVNVDRDTVLVGRQKLVVHSIPDPSLKIGHTIINEQSMVDRNVFFAGDSLKLYFTDDLTESSQWYRIDYFNSGYTYGGAFFYEENKGPFFSKKSLEVIKNQLPGQEFIIKIIAVSPDAKHFRILPIIRFKLL